MRGMRLTYAQWQAKRALRPDVSGLLRKAGGFNPSEQGIRHGHDDGDRAAGEAPTTGANSGSGERVVVFAWPYRELNPNFAGHWSVKARAKRAYRTECWALTRQAGLAPIDWDGLIHVHLTLVPPDKRRRDDDNMVASFKSGRDGMADALGIDDTRFRVTHEVSGETGGRIIARITRERPTC